MQLKDKILKNNYEEVDEGEMTNIRRTGMIIMTGLSLTKVLKGLYPGAQY